MENQVKKGNIELALSAIICLTGIGIVGYLISVALNAGIDGIVYTTGVGVILAIVLAYTGVKVKDVLFRK